jgi:hypothetical protein
MKIVVFEPNDIAFLKGQNFSILQQNRPKVAACFFKLSVRFAAIVWLGREKF